MRAGYHGNTELQKRLERADSGVRPIVEAVVTESEDTVDTKAEWQQADSYANFNVLDIGAITLAGTSSTHITQTTNDTDLTDLAGIHDPPIDVCVIEWSGVAQAERLELQTVIARLNPDTGAGKTVDTWKCQLWRLDKIDGYAAEAEASWNLQPICAPAKVTAGAAPADVTFDFSGYDAPINPGPPPENSEGAPSASQIHYSVTIVHIWGVKDDGSVATNVGWRADSTAATKTLNGHSVSHRTIATIDAQDQTQDATVFTPQAGTACPYIIIRAKTYTAQTITFGGPANLIDQGTTSLNTLECMALAAEFGGSQVTFQIATTASTYRTFADGDEIGSDNSTSGGYDLSALAKAQKYKMRATLTPSADAQATPAVYSMGVRNITSVDLDGLVNVGNVRWAVDPVTLKGEISELGLEFLRDGILDYRDAATEILSDYHLDEVEYNLWIGHPDLDRRRWLYIDRFVEDDRDAAGAGIRMTCVSRLANLREEVPPIVTSTASTSVIERSPVEYSGTAKAIYDDLVENQIALSNRYIGPGIETARSYTRNLRKIRPGKYYLDQLCYLEGGSIISSQGRLKFVSFYDPDSAPPVRATFPQAEIQEISVTPGFASRITDYRVYYGWNDLRDEGRGAFSGEVRRLSTSTIQKLGRARINMRMSENEDTCKWIEASTVGSTSADWIAKRAIERFGHGMILISFRTTYPKPWLEPGDMVAVETDRMVARDPHSDKAIRGRSWTRGRVVGVHDVLGTHFTVWVESYSDFTGSQTNIQWVHYANPEIRDITGLFNASGQPTYLVMGNGDARAVKVAESASTYPNKAAVRTETLHALSTDRSANWTSTHSYSPGDKVYLSGLAYETSTGGGAESVYLFKKDIEYLATDAIPFMTIESMISSSGAVSAVVSGNTLTNSIKIAANTRNRDAAEAFPDSTTIRAQLAIAGQSFGTASIGTLVTLSSGEVADIAGYPYSSTAGGGTEGALAKDTANPYPPDGWIGSDQIADGRIIADKLVESARQFASNIKFYSPDYREVAWTSTGSIYVQSGNTYPITGSSGVSVGTSRVPHFVYFASTLSSNTLSVTKSLSSATMAGHTLLATAWTGHNLTEPGECIIVPAVGGSMMNISSTNIAPDAVTFNHIRAGAITADHIVANAIIASKIQSSAITASKIHSTSISASKIQANSITAAKIAAAAIEAQHIQARVLASSHIDTGTIEVANYLKIGDLGNSTSGLRTDRFSASISGGTTGGAKPYIEFADTAQADLTGFKLSTNTGDRMELIGYLERGQNIKFGWPEFNFTAATTSTGANGSGRLTINVNGKTRYLSFD